MRDLLLFELAKQTGLKMKDLLALNVQELLTIEAGTELPKDTNRKARYRNIFMSEHVQQTFQRYIKNSSLSLRIICLSLGKAKAH